MKLTNQGTKKINPNKGRRNKHIKVAPGAYRSPMDVDMRIPRDKSTPIKTKKKTNPKIGDLEQELEDIKWKLKQAPLNYSNAEYRLGLYERMSAIDVEITLLKGNTKHNEEIKNKQK
jgi:hypothetical protein